MVKIQLKLPFVDGQRKKSAEEKELRDNVSVIYGIVLQNIVQLTY